MILKPNLLMNYIIEPGSLNDVDELEQLYNELNDYLSATVNYPGWIKGIYPIRENALNGVKNNTLFVLLILNVLSIFTRIKVN